jgi:hypothetical protein
METVNNGFRGLETRVFLLSENRKTLKDTASTCGAGQTLQCGISIYTSCEGCREKKRTPVEIE